MWGVSNWNTFQIISELFSSFSYVVLLTYQSYRSKVCCNTIFFFLQTLYVIASNQLFFIRISNNSVIGGLYIDLNLTVESVFWIKQKHSIINFILKCFFYLQRAPWIFFSNDRKLHFLIPYWQIFHSFLIFPVISIHMRNS